MKVVSVPGLPSRGRRHLTLAASAGFWLAASALLLSGACLPSPCGGCGAQAHGRAKIPSSAAPGQVARGPGRAQDHERFHDAASYIEMLERPDRAAYQKPAEVVAALGLRPGYVVADIGAGSGYFTMRLARAVGPTGKVYAEDVWEAMIDHLKARAARDGLANVETVLGLPADPRLPPRSLDLAFICNTWHHIDERAAFLARLAPALKPAGRLVIIDYEAAKTPVGPPVAMRVPRSRVVSELSAAGFRLSSQVGILPYQYFLIFQPDGSRQRR